MYKRNSIKESFLTACTLVFDVLFLNAAESEIPEMFQITHRQNRAVKTQTERGSQSQSHALRAQELGSLSTVPSPPTYSHQR